MSAALAKELPIESSRDSVVEEKPEFNPSWQDFLNFLRTRSEIVLATFLRRVSAPVFLDGRLSIEGGSFDIDSLKESRSLNSLKVGLAAYSGIETWDIRFSVVAPHSDTASEANNANAPRPRTGPVPGSVAMLEAQIEKERVVRVDTEARNSQVVKKALSVFEGSSVERVSVMKREP